MHEFARFFIKGPTLLIIIIIIMIFNLSSDFSIQFFADIGKIIKAVKLYVCKGRDQITNKDNLEPTSINTNIIHRFLYNYKFSGGHYLTPMKTSKEGSYNFYPPSWLCPRFCLLKIIPIASLAISNTLFDKSLSESTMQAPVK